MTDCNSFMRAILEPISYIGTCATEAMWDADLGGSPAAICRYCKGDRQQYAPPRGRFATASSPCLNGSATAEDRCSAPRPTRVAARTAGCCVALLDHIDIWPSSGVLHPAVLATTHHAPIYEIGSNYRRKAEG